MTTYLVRVFVPTVYEIKAESVEQAKQKAIKLYQKQKKTWLEPEVQVEKK